MESQLQLEDLRKAQRELNDAFSFRRSINVDEDGDAFSTTVTTPREGLREGDSPSAGADGSPEEVAAPAASVATEGKPKKKKIRRRIKKKKVPNDEERGDGTVPQDLEMPSPAATTTAASSERRRGEESYTAEELASIDEEFDRYVAAPAAESPAGEDDEEAGAASSSSRFQQQLSGDWNEQILRNEDRLSPLAEVMKKLALLEEQKVAATRRLEEEFERRAEVEEAYYREQRKVLEEAVARVQEDAYADAVGAAAAVGGGDPNGGKADGD